MRRLLIAVLAVLLAGCGGSPPPNAMPSTTTPPTATIAPPTATPVALADVDLAPVLSSAGDLSASYTLEKPTTQPQAMYGQLGVPLADATLTQLFDDPANMGGFATISLYSERPMLSDAYTALTKNMGAAGQSLVGVGDQAMQDTQPAGQLPQASIVFARCRAVVMLQGFGITKADPAALVAWAQKIDQRIQDSPICS